MASFTIHPARPGQPADDVTVIADRWSWPAFLFGVFWLMAKRLWLAALAYALVWLAIVVGSAVFGLHPLAPLLLTSLLGVALALEAGSIERWTLARRGRPATDVVAADNAADAEVRYIVRRANAAALAPASAASAGAPAASGPSVPLWPARDSGIIGLFPHEGGR